MVQFRNSVLAVASVIAVQAATINTPSSLTECIPARLTWSGTSGTVYLSIIPGGQPSAAPLLNLGQFPEGTTGYTWTPSPQEIPAGTSITISLTDGTGAPAYSDQLTIREGSGTCAPSSGAVVSGAASQTSTAAAGASSAASASAAPASSVRSAVSSAASQVTSAGRAASSSASNAAASASPSSTSGASSLAAGGLLGAVVAVAGLVM